MFGLAKEQADVVYAGPGDLFVAAGAGSGKTHILVSRFVAAVLGEGHLDEHRVEEILAITFTDKAAGELAERIRATLIKAGRPGEASAVDEAWVSTIHGMCSRMLRRHALDIGLDPRFAVCTNVQAAVLTQQAFEDAARELLVTLPTLEPLILDFGASVVSRAIISVHGKLRSMGRSSGDVALCAGPTPTELGVLAGEFEALAATFTGFPETMTTTKSATLAHDIAVAILDLAADGSPTELARQLLGTFGTAHFDKRGSVDVKQTAEDGNGLVAATIGALTQTVCAPYEAAFTVLLERFGTRYAALKDSQGLLDFEDLQIETARLLEEHPDVAAGYRAAFRHVMIDEFQDTNALQMRIAQALSNNDLLTVGDDKQSIYRFRHADVSVFQRLEADTDDVRRLRANYRSHADIVGVVNGIFGTEHLFGEGLTRLEPMRDEDGAIPWVADEPRVRMVVVDGRDLAGDEKKDAEARVLARHLAKLCCDRGVQQGDMVVLVRAMQNRAERIERALRAEGFDVYVASGGTFFSRPEVEDLLALLRVIDNPRDDRAFMQVLAGRLTGLSDEALHALAHLPGQCLWESVAGGLGGCGLGAIDGALLGRTIETVHTMRDARGRRSIASLIHEACERLDYDLALFASGPDGPRAWANVLKVARLAGEFERCSAGDLGNFLDYVAAYRDVAPEAQAALASEDIDAVRIMSIHAAKGLEFPVVAVADLGSRAPGDTSEVHVGRGDDRRLAMKLPRSASPDDTSHETAAYTELKAAEADADEAERRRLLYVACTRARDALILCGSADPAKEAKGSCGLDLLRLALGLGEPIENPELEVRLGNGSSVTVSVVHGEAPANEDHPELVELEYDPAAFAQEKQPSPAPVTRPQSISYTGLAVYGACPYKFYVSSILRLRTPESAQPEADALRFGSAVHAVLQFAGAQTPPPDRFVAAARANGLDAEGRERLERAVAAFLGSAIAHETGSGERVLHECPLTVPLGTTILTGSIDLVSWHGTEATVVDYKTGAQELAATVAEERYRIQAECYALAALKAGASAVHVRFIELERGCRETRYEFLPGDARRIETDLLRTLERMERGEYPHLPEFTQDVCGECPALGGLCPINPRRGASAGAGRTPR